MSMKTKLEMTINSETAVKDDSDVEIRFREIPTASPPPSSATTCLKQEAEPSSLEDTSNSSDPNSDHSNNLTLTDAQAHWLAVGENIGTSLVKIRTRLLA